MSHGFPVMVLLTVVGTTVNLVAMWLLRAEDRLWAAPLTQALGFVAAWALAWPLWYASRIGHRRGFMTYVAGAAVPAAVIAYARIALHIG